MQFLRKSIQAIMIAVTILPLATASARHKIYMTYILHGNMNYDRYVRPTIWKEFPVIYNDLMDFMDEHPDFRGQIQFSGQTLGSLQQTAPQVLSHALEIHRRGQLNFTGTFYSEPVNVNMDGETNYRCTWLGTRIVEQITGEKTDGFYLQERAYHPQLPYIFNRTGVTWTPIITSDDSWRPFYLRGLDGSLSICVPITRNDFITKIKQAPAGSLITLEEDYEIPQTFTKAYKTVDQFNHNQNDIEVEWITVKDYIRRFGVEKEKYVDHSAKARHRDNGTYSRWTADPLDIQVQESTNRAMDDLRAAKITNALAGFLWDVEADQPFASSDISLQQDPLTWNIERADLYPDIEPRFLSRNGTVTLLSKAEHLLLWGVNSDAKGWYPLYEKRRERIQSFQNSSRLSRHIIQRAMNMLASQLKDYGYDKYFLVFNAEQARRHTITLNTDQPYTLYDCNTAQPIPSYSAWTGNSCEISADISLPSFGYKLIGARCRQTADNPVWEKGNHIENAFMSITADSTKINILTREGQRITVALDTFLIRSLAELTSGEENESWHAMKPYGPVRTKVCRSGLHPQLCINYQPDWLMHFSETLTLTGNRIFLDISFEFPHPTLIRKNGATKGNTFSPEGLNLIFNTYTQDTVGYDIPYGISEYSKPGLSYFCPLSTMWIQHGEQGGFMVSPQSGEQAFSANLDNGEMTLYLGASTTSGPIRNVGLSYKGKNNIEHEAAWYSEPFHGAYRHRILLQPYRGKWQDAHLPSSFRSAKQCVYVCECHPQGGNMPPEQALIQTSEPNVDITVIDDEGQGPFMRLNEREGRATKVSVIINDKEYKTTLKSYGIATLPLR